MSYVLLKYVAISRSFVRDRLGNCASTIYSYSMVGASIFNGTLEYPVEDFVRISCVVVYLYSELTGSGNFFQKSFANCVFVRNGSATSCALTRNRSSSSM